MPILTPEPEPEPDMTPNAPHRDEPQRRGFPEMPRTPKTHETSEAFKTAIIEGLFARGECASVELLYIARREKKPWFRPRRFLGYEALIRIPGGFIVQGTGQTPESAIMAALNSPAPFYLS